MTALAKRRTPLIGWLLLAVGLWAAIDGGLLALNRAGYTSLPTALFCKMAGGCGDEPQTRQRLAEHTSNFADSLDGLIRKRAAHEWPKAKSEANALLDRRDANFTGWQKLSTSAPTSIALTPAELRWLEAVRFVDGKALEEAKGELGMLTGAQQAAYERGRTWPTLADGRAELYALARTAYADHTISTAILRASVNEIAELPWERNARAFREGLDAMREVAPSERRRIKDYVVEPLIPLRVPTFAQVDRGVPAGMYSQQTKAINDEFKRTFRARPNHENQRDALVEAYRDPVIEGYVLREMVLVYFAAIGRSGPR